jgi:predicted RNase H-like HicB family nuclease
MAGDVASYPQGTILGSQNQEQHNLYVDWSSSSSESEMKELKRIVNKLSEEVNKLDSVINDMGEKMKLCHSMNDEPFRDFTVIVRPDDNGTYVAYVPAIPGCHAWGRTSQEAHAELANVFEMIKEEYEEESKPLPKDIDIEINT